MRSAPRVGPHSEARIIALADMGQAELDGSDEQSEMRPSANTTRLMLRDAAAGEYSLVAHFGDISYARGHVSQWDRCGSRCRCSHLALGCACAERLRVAWMPACAGRHAGSTRRWSRS